MVMSHNVKKVLGVSTDGWIKRYRSNPAEASVEWASTTMRLAERIDRQVGLAGIPPPPVPPAAEHGAHDAGRIVDAATRSLRTWRRSSAGCGR